MRNTPWERGKWTIATVAVGLSFPDNKGWMLATAPWGEGERTRNSDAMRAERRHSGVPRGRTSRRPHEIAWLTGELSPWRGRVPGVHAPRAACARHPFVVRRKVAGTERGYRARAPPARRDTGVLAVGT